eukprot:TRINITY_DN17140_c0_g1_i2.p1 TRINITY_DN17140_c0_g1~~TRINITY_DN17140_c0_g1_i2.p1  ORF type:complete len:101 (-),score=20.01 TRINITY_DN17140_c0_g1_i2:293-595(-)
MASQRRMAMVAACLSAGPWQFAVAENSTEEHLCERQCEIGIGPCMAKFYHLATVCIAYGEDSKCQNGITDCGEYRRLKALAAPAANAEKVAAISSEEVDV